MMSSPTGLQQAETNFLARWMPSRYRAGVILDPSLDLASSPRDSWASNNVEDSFSSQFTPLPTSNSSSCFSDSLVLTGSAHGQPSHPREASSAVATLQAADTERLTEVIDGIQRATTKTQKCSVMKKLKQLKDWQHCMQEQLKEYQMEQLHSLLEEQQKLLGSMHGVRIATSGYTKHSQPTQRERKEYGVQGQNNHLVLSQGEESSSLPGMSNLCGIPDIQEEHSIRTLGPGVSIQSRSSDTLSGDADGDNDPHRTSDREECLHTAITKREGDSYITNIKDGDLLSIEDRPIKPGIGGRKQTFEALLEEELKLEEQRLKITQQEPNPGTTEVGTDNPKRTFLKRGEGLSRFSRGKAALPKKTHQCNVIVRPKTSTCYKSESSETALNSSPRCLVQRKTSLMNKDNLSKHLTSPQDTVLKTKQASRVFSSSQRQYRMASDLGQFKTAQKRKSPQMAGPQGQKAESTSRPIIVTKQVAEDQRDQIQQLTWKKLPPVAEQMAGITQYSFELSFQEKLEHWDSEKQQEKVALGEFELLEQAAEELSFSSNSSFVTKVLQLDQQGGKVWHCRRLSSTPIKSPKTAKTPRAGNGLFDYQGCTEQETVLLLGEREMFKSSSNKEQMRMTMGEEAPCQSNLEFGDMDDTLQKEESLHYELQLHRSNCLAGSPDAQYDRTSYQDDDWSLVQANAEEEHEGSVDGLDNKNNSNFLEDGEQNCGKNIVFDDDDTWNDMVEARGVEIDDVLSVPNLCTRAASDSPLLDKVLKRKVAATKKGVEPISLADTADQMPDPPPTSQLVAKLFPSQKPIAKPAELLVKEPQKPAAEQGEGLPKSVQLRKQLAELAMEIERFRLENAALARLQREREAALETLRREMVEFERRKADELAQLEKYKKEEIRKLQKKQKVFEKHAYAARAIPDRKEREEIQGLRQQLGSLQEELRRREARWSSTNGRLRKQMDTLSTENTALREEVLTLELLRVTAWKKAEAENGKEREKGLSRQQDGTLKQAVSTRPTRDLQTGPASTASRECPWKSPHVTGKTSRKSPVAGLDVKWASDLEGFNKGPIPELLKAAVSPEEEKDHEELTYPDGKIERVLQGGMRLVVFPNGTRKEVSADGQEMKVTFFNGDVKQIMADQRVIYFYADAQTTHTTYPDGIEVLQFPNNQIEKHFPDGRKEITFPNQTIKNLYPNGKEESVYPDGTIIEVQLDGTQVIQFNNGQREVHTAEFKRREYPDGTVKTIYSDGRQETCYPTGRVRVKNKDGHVVVDTRTPTSS